MNNQDLISVYEAVAVITDQMLTAARAGDWDTLIELEKHCADHVKTLQSREPGPPLRADERERKVKIIHSILEDDRQIRNLTEPWMAQLSYMINSTGAERKLLQAYGAQQSG